MKYFIKTLGCKVNSYESEIIKEQLEDANYISSLENEADVIIINTCSVTNTADNKSLKYIRSARRNNKKAILIVCGCSSENKKEYLLDLGVNILIGNKDKSNIINYINSYKENKKPITKYYDLRNEQFENMVLKSNDTKVRAFVKIQDGCDNYCSYCIIPFLRGKIRSKDFNTAISEINNLVKLGHKEIVLTGIHTGSYGRGTNYDLVDLINIISVNNDLKRIRISSIEITEINDKFLKMLNNNKVVCNHLHIPLQSGSDDILKLMNRKYDLNYYKKIINKIRKIRPTINITTDVIVGFPNETDKSFNNTLKFCKKMKFGKIHVFPYSKRDKTKASIMSNQVEEYVKKERSKKLIQLSDKLENKYYKRFKNKIGFVLIEEVKENYSIGMSSNYIKVKINSKLELNELYKVKIICVNALQTIGKVIE